MGRTARERLRAIEWEQMGIANQLRGGYNGHPPAEGEHRDALMQQMAELGVEHRRVQQEVLREQEVRMSRSKAREMRKAFRDQSAAVAARYKESQSDRYPAEYRQREGAAIRKELDLLEAQHSRDMLLWHHSQRVEAARLRAADPVADPATETRKLRERMEADALAAQYPSRTQARNILLPEAERLLNAGNIDAAQVHLDGRTEGRRRHVSARPRGQPHPRPDGAAPTAGGRDRGHGSG